MQRPIIILKTTEFSFEPDDLLSLFPKAEEAGLQTAWADAAVGETLAYLFDSEGRLLPDFHQRLSMYPEVHEAFATSGNITKLASDLSLKRYAKNQKAVDLLKKHYERLINKRKIDKTFITENRARLQHIVDHPDFANNKFVMTLKDKLLDYEFNATFNKLSIAEKKSLNPVLQRKAGELLENAMRLHKAYPGDNFRTMKLTYLMTSLLSQFEPNSKHEAQPSELDSVDSNMKIQIDRDSYRDSYEEVSDKRKKNGVIFELHSQYFFIKVDSAQNSLELIKNYFVKGLNQIQGDYDLGLEMSTVIAILNSDNANEKIRERLTQLFGSKKAEQFINAWSRMILACIPDMLNGSIEGKNITTKPPPPQSQHLNVLLHKDGHIYVIYIGDKFPVVDQSDPLNKKTLGDLPPVKAVFMLTHLTAENKNWYGFQLKSIHTDDEDVATLLRGNKFIPEYITNIKMQTTTTRPLKHIVTTAELRELHLENSPNFCLKIAATRLHGSYFEEGEGGLSQVKKDYHEREWLLKGYRHLGTNILGSTPVDLNFNSKEAVITYLKQFFNNDEKVVNQFIDAHSQGVASFIPFTLSFCNQLSEGITPSFYITQPLKQIINLIEDPISKTVYVEAYFEDFPVVDKEGNRRILPGPAKSRFKLETRGNVSGFELVSVESDNPFIIDIVKGHLPTYEEIINNTIPEQDWELRFGKAPEKGASLSSSHGSPEEWENNRENFERMRNEFLERTGFDDRVKKIYELLSAYNKELLERKSNSDNKDDQPTLTTKHVIITKMMDTLTENGVKAEDKLKNLSELMRIHDSSLKGYSPTLFQEAALTNIKNLLNVPSRLTFS